jgi:AcrR family transcriptional regulator
MPNARPRSRRPGRPAARGGAALRDRVLDAAVLLIARQGAAGTTSSAIARRARVTPALLHYYFGSKARIIDALFAERIDPVFTRIMSPLRADAAGGEFSLQRLVHSFIEGVSAEPWLPQILAREVLSEGGVLRARFVEQRRPMAQRLVRAMQAAQAAGRVRADLDARLIVLSMMSAIVYPLVAAPVWRELLPLRVEETTPAKLAAHVARVLERGLEGEHA